MADASLFPQTPRATTNIPTLVAAAAVNPGNSGGPLLSAGTGEVLGLVDLGTTTANGLAFAVSSRVASPLLSAWRIAPQLVSAADVPVLEDGPRSACVAVVTITLDRYGHLSPVTRTRRPR